ncbi:MAG: arginase family protein [Solirubrobacterales bacterium]
MPPFTFIGVPIDSVGRAGGTEHGPAALRKLGLPAALGGPDGGDLAVRIRGEIRDPATGILASDAVLATTTAIRAAVGERIAAGGRPLLAGGCCAELPGALAGARDALGPLGLVNFDGHMDLYDGETSPTGEAADMPVSVALGLGPAGWVATAGGASVGPGQLSLLGFRDREESVEAGMRQPETLDPRPLVHPVEAVRSDPGGTGAEVAAALAGAGPFWLHFDVDALDQAAFPATDYLMSGGLAWPEVDAALAALAASPRLVGVSLGCYNPEKDPGAACGRRLVELLGGALGASAPGERRTKRSKDAGRPNSSAIWPTEDAAPRRVRRRRAQNSS